MRSDPELYAAYGLAEHLGMTVTQVYAMSEVEFLGWFEFFKVRKEKK